MLRTRFPPQRLRPGFRGPPDDPPTLLDSVHPRPHAARPAASADRGRPSWKRRYTGNSEGLYAGDAASREVRLGGFRIDAIADWQADRNPAVGAAGQSATRSARPCSSTTSSSSSRWRRQDLIKLKKRTRKAVGRGRQLGAAKLSATLSIAARRALSRRSRPCVDASTAFYSPSRKKTACR